MREARPGCCPGGERVPPTDDEVIDAVRERYGRIAASGSGSCCGADGRVAENLGYDPSLVAAVPDGANLGLGCGAPVGHLDLRSGEVVLDLGSGAGLDAFLAASLVGPTGRVIGVDMTPEMIERGTANAARANHANVEFRLGRLERLPVGDASVDAVTSNCVINLVPDKTSVFREIARVLKPGGRVVISDIVLDGELPAPLAESLLARVGCVAGAVERDEYFRRVEAAGLHDVRVLDDRDYLAAVGDDLLPEDVRELLRELGIGVDEIGGKVRSITFRAARP